MKITANLPPELGLGAAPAAGQGQEARGPTGAGAAVVQLPQVELMTDAGIRLLLGELTKVLDRQASLQGQLPPTVAMAAGEAASQTEGGLPQGLAALLKGARNGAESMATLAGRLEAAASLARAFPAGLPPALAELAATVTTLLAELSPAIPATPTTPAAPNTATAPATPAIPGTPAVPTTPATPAVQATPTTPAAPAGSAAAAPLTTAAAPTGSAVTTTVLPMLKVNGPAATPIGQPMAEAAANATPAVKAAATAAVAAQTTIAATAAEALTVLTGELARAAAGQAAELPTVTSLRQALAEAVPERPAPLVRAAVNQATTALAAFLPATDEKAAAGKAGPSLREGLALLKVADSQQWLKLPEATLRQAAATLHELAAVTPTQQTADTAGNQNVLAMTVPLYLGPDGKAYPAYIHISQEQEKGGQAQDGATVRDTWLRVCLATENIGLVDLVFHVWGDRQLSIRALFSEPATVEDFRRLVPDIRQELAASPLTLTDISVVATQGR